MGIVSGYEPWNINKKFVRSRFAGKFVYVHNKPSIDSFYSAQSIQWSAYGIASSLSADMAFLQTVQIPYSFRSMRSSAVLI